MQIGSDDITTLSDLFKGVPGDLSLRDGVDTLAMMDPWIWAMRKRRLRGSPAYFDYIDKINRMSFVDEGAYLRELSKHRPFLIEPLRDMHKHKVYQKGRQVGVSEVSITENLAFLDSHPKTKAVYTFPRDKQLQDFSVTRINAMLEETPSIRRIFGVPNQVFTKKIGESFLLLRSAWESNLGEGIDADMVTLDEKDRMKDGVEVAFRESLSGGGWGLFREVSTPTLPGRGINIIYQQSDQREWHVKCKKCGLEQTVEYPENVIQMKDFPQGTTEYVKGTFEYMCKMTKCRGLLDRMRGRWIAKYPTREKVRGYFMPQTIAPWISATDLMQKLITYKWKSLWENYSLGKTSLGDTTLLTESDFDAITAGYQLQTHRTQDWKRVIAAVDWGYKNWILILGMNENGIFYVIGLKMFEDTSRELESVKEAETYIRPFVPDLIIPDAGYGKDRNAYLLRRFGKDRVTVCNYNPSPRGTNVNNVWQPNQNKVTVDRTMTLKVMARTIKDREIGFPVNDGMTTLLRKHLANLAPIRQEEDGTIIEIIDKLGDDHLAHCLNLALIGMDSVTEGNRFNFSFVDS